MLTLIILTLIAGLSAVIDTIAGGGGLITVPAMLLSGMSPVAALATNKFQATFGAGTATWQFAKHGAYPFRKVVHGIVACMLGAILGTLCVQRIDLGLTRWLIPIVLSLIWLTLLFSPQLGRQAKRQRCHQTVFFCMFGLLLGAYDGFLGPGTGSFWVFAIITVLGWSFTEATMHTKLYNFISNLASLLVFLLAGCIHYKLGVAMAVGQVAGGYVGSRIVITHGQYWIRPLLLIMTGLMIVILVARSW